MMHDIPDGYQRCEVPGGWMVASRSIAAWAKKIVQEHGSLEEFARLSPNARVVRGRGPAYLIAVNDRLTAMVRRLRHGGFLSRFSGDRFLLASVPRPVNELITAAYLSRCGIETPEVLAACVYSGRLTYRGEILRVYEETTPDLAEFLFGTDAPDSQRERALAGAVAMAGRLAHAGIFHADFNARNILVRSDGEGVRTLVIDLEKASRCPVDSSTPVRRMKGRLLRSLRKLAETSGRPLPASIEILVAEAPSGG